MAKATQNKSVSAETKAGIPAIVDDPREIIESVLIRGDLSKMDSAQRTDYYMRVCQSIGLNPLTKPFEYIILNGKLTLYARRDCTDQLRAVHNVSVTELTEDIIDGVHLVKCKVKNGKDRTDMSTGAVSIVGLKGEALANALMKAETKAKRRATLSICGLGFLDETEIADIPETAKQRVPSPSDTAPIDGSGIGEDIGGRPHDGEIIPPQKAPPARQPAKADPKPAPDPETAPAVKPDMRPAPVDTSPRTIDVKGMMKEDFCAMYLEALALSRTPGDVKQWRELNLKSLGILENKGPELYEKVLAAEQQMLDNLGDRTAPSGEMSGEEITGDASDRAKTADMPDVEKDPDAFVQWAVNIVGTFKDYDAAAEWFNEIIEPLGDKLFPPDKEEIVGALRRLEEKLAP